MANDVLSNERLHNMCQVYYYDPQFPEFVKKIMNSEQFSVFSDEQLRSRFEEKHIYNRIIYNIKMGKASISPNGFGQTIHFGSDLEITVNLTYESNLFDSIVLKYDGGLYIRTGIS